MRKGFTLIELLAVIVILAIVALIATPLIMNVIEQSKTGAFKNTAYGIIEAGELSYAQDVLKGTVGEVTFTYNNGEESSEPSGRSLQYKGTKPQNGTVIINDKGEVALAIHDGTNCAQKGFDESKVYMSDKTVDKCIITGDGSVIGGTGGDVGDGGTTPVTNSDTSGASAPELTTGMIPVKWDETNQIWIKADANNEAGANQWYDYDAKMWANAVTVTSTNRSTYESAAVGTTIAMSDINTMWVWIPRYSYYIPTSGTTTPSEIQINFESKTDSKSTGDAVSTYLTHPAFTFGTTELSGMWVGKFETTGDIALPTILPNTTSLRSQTVSAMYDASRAMEDNATYGTSTDGDIHMMKDSEWGAVAYLSHSIYGKNAEISINDSSSYYTGGGTSGAYIINVNQSTTGNIYGIYDMSGGAWEYTMSNYYDQVSGSGFFNIEYSFFDNYMDRYTTDVETTACSGGICYGSALSETSGWYNDEDRFVTGTYPWSDRGGYYNSSTSAGVFHYSNGWGSSSEKSSFRIVQMKP